MRSRIVGHTGAVESGGPSRRDLQAQIDAVITQLNANRSDIDDLIKRADSSEERADRSESRADAAELRELVDRDMIADLQRDGILSQEHADQMDEALKSSRVIGSAIGMIMASRDLSEPEAFQVLRTASQNSNRKLRDLATELVGSADADTALQDPSAG